MSYISFSCLLILKDGNLEKLKEEINTADSINLDELSYGAIPYPPLFIAYMHDHYQVLKLE